MGTYDEAMPGFGFEGPHVCSIKALEVQDVRRIRRFSMDRGLRFCVLARQRLGGGLKSIGLIQRGMWSSESEISGFGQP